MFEKRHNDMEISKEKVTIFTLEMEVAKNQIWQNCGYLFNINQAEVNSHILDQFNIIIKV